MSPVYGFWSRFVDAHPHVDRDELYQSFYFGNTRVMANELADLVKDGKKVASASLVDTNIARPDEAPILGGYSVVTDWDSEPVCVIRTIEIDTVPFIDVDERFAADEGEGDLSLDWWREAHRAYFQKEADELGFIFDDGSLVCCERFVCLFRG